MQKNFSRFVARTALVVLMSFPVIASAHETDATHEETPITAQKRTGGGGIKVIGGILIVAGAGLLGWKFLLKKPPSKPIA